MAMINNYPSTASLGCLHQKGGKGFDSMGKVKDMPFASRGFLDVPL